MKTITFIISLIAIIWLVKKSLPSPKILGAVTNALLAEHYLSLVELIGENPYVNELKSGIVAAWRHSGFPNMEEEDIYAKFNRCTRFEQLNILAMAFNELNDEPMLADEFWHSVKNPFLPRLDDEQYLKAVADRLKAKHGVDIHIPQERLNISDWDIKLIPEKSNSSENLGSTDTENINTSKTTRYGYGTLVHQEVKAVLDTVDTYLSQFGDKKPESITLNPFEWAVMDLTLRQSTGNTESLHTHGYNDLRINCKANRCYCHHFLDDPEVRGIVKTLNNYLEIMGNKAPTNLPIDDAARQKLNNRFEYFFDGAFNLDSKPHLAVQIIRVTGQVLYKSNNI